MFLEPNICMQLATYNYHILSIWKACHKKICPQIFMLLMMSVLVFQSPVQELCDSFKSMCQKCLQLVPSKSLSNSIKYSWITPQIKRLSNRKQRLYNCARYTGQQSDWLAYCKLKKVVQYECCKAHNRYVADLTVGILINVLNIY